MTTNVRPNYFNLQTFDVQDAQQEHDYLVTRDEEIAHTLGLNGVTDVSGLAVTEDSVVIETFEYPKVTHGSNRPELLNYLDFPFDTERTSSSRIYSVFKATANNLQRLDLRIQILPVTNTSFVTISVVALQNPSDPLSGLSDEVLTRRIYQIADLPTATSSDPLVVDFSGDNDRQGIDTDPDSYYAVTIDFSRATASQDTLRVFHSNRSQTAEIDSSLYSWIFFGTRFQQGLYNSEATFEQFTMYMKVYTAAVQVAPGSAFAGGKPIRITEAQRSLGLVARGASKPKNYIVATYAEEVAATESAARTGNASVSRLADSFLLQVFSQDQYNDFLATSTEPSILLAIVQDRNVLNFRKVETLTVGENANLAYHDWLAPINKQPSLAGLAVVNQRPDDYVFIVDNVPSSVLLADFDGVPVLDQFGQRQKDLVVNVYLDLFLDGGRNLRTLQMSSVKETTSVPSYRTYAATLTAPTNTDLVDYSYPFDVKELTTDTFYNFRLVTQAGNTIYIQDFDRVANKQNPVTGLYESLRSQQYSVAVEAADIVIQIDEDLKLGQSSLSSGASGQELLGYKVVFHDNEPATGVGVSVNERIIARTDTLHATDNYLFGPLPVANRDGSLVLNNDKSLLDAYNAGDITLLVDGVDITFSGSTSRDKGGRGAPMTIFGELVSSDKTAYIGKKITFRNADNKDNTQQKLDYVLKEDTTTGKIEFTAIALGRGNDSDAGFSAGDDVYVYVDDRPALDANNIPLVVTFNAYNAISIKIFALGSRKYFTGKVIVAAGDHVVAGIPSPDVGEVAIDPESGLVYFPEGEVPYGTISIQYLQLNSEVKQIDYYKTNTAPFGTSLKQPINNDDNAVATAVARGEIVITIDGRDIRSNNALSSGAVKIVADRQEDELAANTISINPLLGKIVFHDSFTEGDEPTLTPESVVAVSYYHLIPIIISTVSQNLSVYDIRYDLNGDGRIDEEDLAVFQAAYGTSANDPNYNSACDFNNDGKVDSDDQTEFERVFGTTSTGRLDYDEASEARLNSIFAYNRDNPSDRVAITRAVSQKESALENGKTLLFVSTETPITERGVYIVVFGYPNLLQGTVNTTVVTTEVEFVQPIDYGSITGYNQANTADTVTFFDSTTAARNTGAAVVYDTTFYFSPAVRTSGTWVFESHWQGRNLNVFSRRKPVTPVEYETSQRSVYGPFDIVLPENGFAFDGTVIELAIGPRDSLYSDGTAAPSGKYVHGTPINEMFFKVILRVKTTDGSLEVDEWIWDRLKPDSVTGLLRLEFNDALIRVNRNKGRNGAVVLQPFGLAPNQIALKPQYAGGDIDNSLLNVLVFRDSSLADIQTHSHSDSSDGGVLLADNVVVRNNVDETGGCQFAGDNPKLSQVLCELLKKIEGIRQIGDFGNEIVSVSGCTPQYGGTSNPIRIPTKVGDVCYAPCAPMVAVNPPWNGGLGGWGDTSSYYYYTPQGDCCTVRIKVGNVGDGYFEVEYCINPENASGIVLDFNWAACGPIVPCTEPVPPPKLIGQVNALQTCQFHFSAFVACDEGSPTYFWDLGDGVHTSNERDFDFTYEAQGTYKVSLVATCTNGQVFTDSLIVVAC